MLQFYFFTVVSLLLAGLILFFHEKLADRVPEVGKYLQLFENVVFRLIVGLVTMVMGLFNLFQNNAISITVGEAVIEQGAAFLVGDLLPGLAGLWTGAILVANFFSQRYNLNNWLIRTLNSCMMVRVPLGLVTVVIALLHLVLPQALFI